MGITFVVILSPARFTLRTSIEQKLEEPSQEVQRTPSAMREAMPLKLKNRKLDGIEFQALVFGPYL